jgi:lipoate---protein ligase
MRLLDISYTEPARNLALEEVLLECVAAGHSPDTLRFWESPVPFVAIGSSQRLREEANEFYCLRDGVPILRRCSAGGAVLQGPGCLNFALALSYEGFPETAALHESYAFILGKIAAALKSLGVAVERQGISDLAMEGLKCSGNAQRRKRTACLHHGTLLYRADMAAINRYLREPADRPDYRGARIHSEFVRAMEITSEALRKAVQQVFCPLAEPEVLLAWEEKMIFQLAEDKYLKQEWNYRR